ncbi:neprilysin-1-like [Cimex lectularius]|uniref:Endothelin-converting enzyme n=1 Tax=Cimex lectularius TaxID=79782 RepID=A0A8I6SDE9_CIMLE|nr:neprilysin-1-like [Cimex lectularius]
MKKLSENCSEVPSGGYKGCLANGGLKKDIFEIVENPLDPGTTSQRVVLLRTEHGTHNVTVILVTVVCVLVIALAVVGIILYSVRKCNAGTSDPGVCISEHCVKTAASLLNAMDKTVDPCEDFFQFACGSWNKRHQIPEDRSSISVFEVLSDQLQVILKGVLEEPYNTEDIAATRKAKLFYKTCMDIKQIRAVGDKPLRQALNKLGGWPVVVGKDWRPPGTSIEHLLGTLRGIYNEGVLIEQWIGPDDKNSSVNIVQLDQMSLALPSKDYYVKPTSDSDYLEAYHKYMTEVAILLGANATTAGPELLEVIQFEKRLANVSLPEADRHDTSAIYRKMTIRELKRLVPQVDWLEYLKTFLHKPIDDTETVVTYGLPYFSYMGQALAETDKRVIYNYILWRLVMTVTPHMIDAYQAKHTEFKRILQGIQSERNRWSQCVEWTNKKMGMAVGALYIKNNFDQNSKKVALEMIHTIRDAFNELLEENHWMDNETRAVAKEKANAMNERIGYPELLTSPQELNKEYTLLNVTDKQFLENIFNIFHYDALHNLEKFRLPVDKDKWSTEPAIVNAFYNPNKNDIVFPAGILQPLFYSRQSPKSLNYGGIGVVIGHEITHGFDDKGRQFDKDGNMMQWWNNATINKFRERAKCFIDQYSQYKLPLVDQFINGRMTQGENIADNGGLKQSFRAYKKWVAQNGEEKRLPGMEDLSHDQLFFLNYAQIWCGTMRPEDALTKIRSAVHSPGPIRVIGPLSNLKEFSKAFSCPLGSPMNPPNKCSVW